MINKEDTNTKKRVRYPFSCEEKMQKAITFRVYKMVVDVEYITLNIAHIYNKSIYKN